jgi:NitT/TauT family transport system substrate-binding protein
MAKRRVSFLVVCLLVPAIGLLTGCGSGPGGQPSQKTTLAMGYIPNVQFTPFYVAIEKGYFAYEGIEIEFDYGWETDLLKLVGSDELHFAIASGDQVVLAQSQRLPVVYVLNWYRRFPVCVMSLAEKKIQSPADLLGKRVGTPVTYGASYIGWRALLDATDLDEKQVELVTIGYNQVAALKAGQVDAALCYAMNEPVQMRAAGEAVDIIYVADYANLVSNGLITNEKSIQERPELVQGMVRAALRGIAYTLEHPDEAFDIALQYIPEAANDEATRAVNRAILAESIEFWRVGSGELGHSEMADWQTSQQIMQQMGLVGIEVEVVDMFTNRFIVGVKE